MYLILFSILYCVKFSDCFLSQYYKQRFSDLTQSYHKHTFRYLANIDAFEKVITQASSDGDFAQTFVAQKNYILLEKFLTPINGNLTEAAIYYVNFCDESFNVFLNDRISNCEEENDKQILGKVRYEINSARQKKLIEADKILKGILLTGELKKMEAKLQYHLRRADIDMAFMVILQLNIEDAINAKAETAYQVMQHLGTLITEHQDAMVSAPVLLMRLLVRTDDPFVRKQMLRQKLLIGDNLTKKNSSLVDDNLLIDNNSVENNAIISPEPMSTTSPQCEHIVVGAVKQWGGAEVTVIELEDTITDVLSQMSGKVISYTYIYYNKHIV